MTAPDLDAIRARAEAATDGPWETVPTVGNAVVGPDGDGYWSDVADRIETGADAEFIARAREDIPALLDEVERLRQENRRVDDLRAERDRLAAENTKLSSLLAYARESRDAHAATLDRVREMADSAPPLMTKSGYVAGVVSASALLAAIEGTDS